MDNALELKCCSIWKKDDDTCFNNFQNNTIFVSVLFGQFIEEIMSLFLDKLLYFFYRHPVFISILKSLSLNWAHTWEREWEKERETVILKIFKKSILIS